MRNSILATCISLLSTLLANSQNITRGPYLQQPTETSIILRWRTNQPSISNIKYGTSKNSLNLSQTIDNQATEHIIKLQNLLPATKYFYQILAGDKIISSSENNYFKTAPSQNSTAPIYIWAGGDFADFSQEYYKVNQTQVRDAYLKYSKNFEPDLWFWLGDAGYEGNRDVKLQESIFDFYGPTILNHVPFAATLGNHEFDEDREKLQKTREVHLLEITSPPTKAEAGGVPSNTKAFYSFNYGNTHFINLDSYGMDDGLYRVYDSQGAQYQWLLKDLEANKSMWTVIFFHHPPYTKRNHDSDIEDELRLIREKLVPIFDKYKVDLVLNGHSHIYERSYLMQDHLGQTPFFDPTYHIVNKSSGKYLKNEPPFINKTNGTVYVVAGSFGRLEPLSLLQLGNPPHPSSVYSNLVNGGSLALKIEANRLDLEWLCADGLIRDRFTMFKNVNKTQKINLEYGQSAKLTASWVGNYRWNTGVINKKEIDVKPLATTNFSVKDSLGFLVDNFEITVTAQPKISALITSTETICNGKTVAGKIILENTNFEKWQYNIQLSDENGLFEKPTLTQALTSAEFALKIPENIVPSDNYKIKVTPNSDLFAINILEKISIQNTASGQFLNQPIIPFIENITLKIKLSGSLPIDYKLNFLPLQTGNQQEIEINVNQNGSKNYILEAVSNICGAGQLTNAKIVIEAPLANELQYFGVKVYPNPTENLLYLEVQKTGKLIGKIIGANAQVFIEKEINFGINSLNLTHLSAGIYLLEITNNKGVKKVMKIVKN